MSSSVSPAYFLITGAAGGIGFETADALASAGQPVIVTARSQSKADEAVKRIQARHPALSLQLLASSVDLCDLDSIERLCHVLIERPVLLRGVICNAGANATLQGEAYGMHVLWVNNYLGHYHLVRLLLPLLQRTARVTRREGRVVHVSSVMHRSVSSARLFTRGAFSPRTSQMYGNSKLAQVLFSFDLQRRYSAHSQGAVTSIAVNPGAVSSDIWRYIPAPFSWVTPFIFRLLFLTPQEGSCTSVYAATMATSSSRLDYLTPYYTSTWPALNSLLDLWGWSASPQLSRASEDAYNEADAAKLWQLSEQQLMTIRRLTSSPYTQ